MQRSVLCVLAMVAVEASISNPIKKVLSLMSELEGKIIAEGESAQKLYAEKAAFCEERSKQLSFEMKTGKGDIADLGATMDQQSAVIVGANTKIEDLSSDISTDEKNLKEATAVRAADAADFAAMEKESKEVISSLDRSIAILNKEMSKKGAAMLQLKSSNNIQQALAVLVQGSALRSDDVSRLTALVQKNTEMIQDADSDESDDMLGAPAAAATEEHSSGIISVLEGMLEKAEEQLESARKAEANSRGNFQMLEQSLKDEMKFAEKDLATAKKELAMAQEKKSVATGDLDVTSKDVKGDQKTKKVLHHECMMAAQEFEIETKARSTELEAVGKAKKIIVEATSLVQDPLVSDLDTEEAPSLVQVESSVNSAAFKAVHFVRELAQTQHSPELAQLASRMASTVRLGTNSGHNPFGKVRNLIEDMLAKLEGEMSDSANQKAYCDKEMAETKAKNEEKTTEVTSLSTKIDQRRSASAKLKEQVATLQKELAAMSSAIAGATQLRNKEKAAYNLNKAEMSQGLQGVTMALKVLREYYAKSADSQAMLLQTDEDESDSTQGAGGRIITLLEEVEMDMTKSLTEITTAEEEAAAEYEDFAQANSVEQLMKEKDATYKTKEHKSLDKAVSELSGDLSGVQDEHDAIMEYDEKIKKACIAKADPYEEVVKRRQQEMDGLKEALNTLQQESSFFQRKSKRTLRGALGQ